MQMNDQETIKKLGCCTFISYSEIYIYILEEGWMAMAIFGP